MRAQPQELGLPTSAYTVVDEISAVRAPCTRAAARRRADSGCAQDASGLSHKVFAHLPSDVGAYEAEEIGVEHLLRDVKDATVSTLATRISAKLDALRSLEERLREIRCYMDHVLAGRLPLNHDIMAHLQDVVNLLPNLNVAELVRAFAVKTNDMMLVIYLSSIIRSVTAVHNLINNKVLNLEREALQDAAEASPPPVMLPAN